MTDPLRALERSLREGPPDEAGYRPKPFDRPSAIASLQPHATVQVEPVSAIRTAGSAQTAPLWQYLAAVLVVAVGVATIGFFGNRSQSSVGGPTSAPTGGVAPTPSPQGSAAPSSSAVIVPALTETFVSPRNGFSLRYPAGWTVTPATEGWPANTYLPYGNPALDTLERAREARLIISTQVLGLGQTEEAWLAAFFRPFDGPEPCAGDWTTWPRIDIGGQSGYLDAVDCPVPADSKISDPDISFDALVFSGGRVYQIGLDGDVDLAYFEALLATVQLDPASAR